MKMDADGSKWMVNRWRRRTPVCAVGPDQTAMDRAEADTPSANIAYADSLSVC
jgi:hypothetical protein